MNYEIIKDEEKLREFIKWLPELKPTEKYYLCLFARSKYTKDENGVNGIAHIKSDKAQLKRFVSDKERMYDKIKQLEVEVGCYKQKDTPIPQQALALYITPNPREMWKATVNSMVKLAQCIRDNNILVNPHQEVLSEIQRTKSRTCYIDFDVDCGDRIDIATRAIYSSINKEAVTWLRTRGGIHALIDPNKVTKEYQKSFYQKITKIEDVDQTGDNMIPVPGCTQGNFIPHFLNL